MYQNNKKCLKTHVLQVILNLVGLGQTGVKYLASFRNISNFAKITISPEKDRLSAPTTHLKVENPVKMQLSAY